MACAIAGALLGAAPSAAAPVGELAPFVHPDGCAAARQFQNGKPGPTGIPTCRVMSRQHGVDALVASPDARRLYSIDARLDSVVAYRTLAAGGVRELTGPGSCAPLAGARVNCTFKQVQEDERHFGGAAISPDGRFLYVASRVGPAYGPQDAPRTAVIDIFRAEGGLERVGCLSSDGTDGRGTPACATVRGVTSPTAVVASPDGGSLYVVSSRHADGPRSPTPPDEGIAAFRRDPESGALTQLEGPAGCITREGAGGACAVDPAVESPSDLAMAPGGEAAYLTTTGGEQGVRGGVLVLRRDRATGAIELARGPGSCVGAFSGRTDCTAEPQMEFPQTVSVAPDGRMLYVGSYDVMLLLGVDQAAGTIERRGCLADGFPKACARLMTDPSLSHVQFAADGRSGILSSGSDIESFTRDPESGALTSRGCVASEPEDTPCSSPPFPDVASDNPVLTPSGVVYTGEARTIYTYAPGASPLPPATVRPSGGRVLVPVRCDAASTCRGTIELEPYSERIGVGPVKLSVPAGRTRNVVVPLPAAVQRAIKRHRRLTFLATTRIAFGGRRGLLSSRPMRVLAAGGTARVTCRSGGVRTLARTSRMRVYTVRTPGGREGDETTYACLFAAGRQVRLDEPDLWTAYGPFELVGSLLAYDHELTADGEYDASSHVRVMNLRTGRELREVCAAGPAGCGFDSGDSEIYSIVMLPNGAVAWTAVADGENVVVKADAGGKERVLDHAYGRISLGSLRLNGNRITWKRSGKTRSATLR